MFSADRLPTKCVLWPKNGPVPNHPVNGYLHSNPYLIEIFRELSRKNSHLAPGEYTRGNVCEMKPSLPAVYSRRAKWNKYRDISTVICFWRSSQIKCIDRLSWLERQRQKQSRLFARHIFHPT